jgi:anti-sigma28 factor (negative regulator of flagellin synthesis)
VDTGRVESVQRALATGTFQVDPARTADKLMQLELIMNGRD